MNSNWCNAGELIYYSVGGGWGKEKTDNNYDCNKLKDTLSIT